MKKVILLVIFMTLTFSKLFAQTNKAHILQLGTDNHADPVQVIEVGSAGLNFMKVVQVGKENELFDNRSFHQEISGSSRGINSSILLQFGWKNMATNSQKIVGGSAGINSSLITQFGLYNIAFNGSEDFFEGQLIEGAIHFSDIV